MILKLFVAICSPLFLWAAGCALHPEKDKESPQIPLQSEPSSLEDCASQKAPLTQVKAQLAKLVPFELAPDLSQLSPEDREAIEYLIWASFCMDQAFMRQVNEWNYCIQEEFARSVDPGNPWYQAYFDVMFGPWDRLEGDKPFLEADPKPAGANYYPLNLTREEWEAHLAVHPESRKAFLSPYTMIRRDKGLLKAIAYSDFFKDQLDPAAERLQLAAKATSNISLKRYLNSRAQSFLANDYFQSDLDWIDLDGDIEAVLGPYEVYEDGLFGYKAAFEAHICVVDHEESAKLEKIEQQIDAMEAHLPLPDAGNKYERGSSSPVKVVHQVYAAGDAKAGVLTAAFNLPNDERVRELKGSKKVLLKNVMKAKFEACGVPIAEAVLADDDLAQVAFEAFFNIVLMHEVSHSLGPGKIVKNGRETTVNLELKECDAPLEECKADVLSLYNIRFLIDQGVLPDSLNETLYASYLADLFRTLRFGIDTAHGASTAVQLNYLLKQGAVGMNAEGLYFVDESRIDEAIVELAREVLGIQARGDYAAALRFLANYRNLGPETAATLDRLQEIPVDIRPIYPLAEKLKVQAIEAQGLAGSG